MSFLEFVENRLSDAAAARPMKGAVTSFMESCAMQSRDDASEETLRWWMADMTVAGLKQSSRRKYLGILHALYKEWGNDNAINDDPFERVMPAAVTGSGIDTKRPEANLACIKRLLAVSPSADNYADIAIFLYLLFNVEATMQDAIDLKFSDSMPALSQLDDIVGAMRASTRQKYVFRLGQGKKRDGQIMRDMVHRMASVVKSYGLDFATGLSRDSITAIWIAAAMKAGIPAAEIRSLVSNVPKEFSHLQPIGAAELSSGARLQIMQKVADSVHDHASHWYVMKMRTGNTPDNIKKAITDMDPNLLREITFYYPTHTAVTIDKKGRRRKEEQPYLPGLLFFRLRSDKVASLFKHIGHLAWCYRWVNAPDSPYCTISLREMRIFQKQVGSFTPDVKMSLVTRETPPLAEGQQVRINGGGFLDNLMGVIRSVKNDNGTRTYTVALSCRDFLTWTVTDLDEAYLQPADA